VTILVSSLHSATTFWSDEENAEWTEICLAHLGTIDYTLEAWTAVKYVVCPGHSDSCR